MTTHKTLDFLHPDTRLTRAQVSTALTDCGIPTAERTLTTKATRGGGPPYSRFGKRVVYRWGDVVDWALATMGAPASNSSEHAARSSSQRAN